MITIHNRVPRDKNGPEVSHTICNDCKTVSVNSNPARVTVDATDSFGQFTRLHITPDVAIAIKDAVDRENVMSLSSILLKSQVSKVPYLGQLVDIDGRSGVTVFSQIIGTEEDGNQRPAVVVKMLQYHETWVTVTPESVTEYQSLWEAAKSLEGGIDFSGLTCGGK